ncbi:MAG: DUF4129 domain-containing protein, partial [Thermoguttaceae bacterium]|nr:DUF4129 domain-containing protein [Thermoguttaceae bacterium]
TCFTTCNDLLYLSYFKLLKRFFEERNHKPGNVGAFPSIPAFSQIALEVLFWTALIVAVCFAARFIYIMAKNGRLKNSESLEKKNRERRLETLAPESRERFDDLAEAARAAFEAGDYRAAIIYYFSWFLVEADKRRLLLMEKGKTNREYFYELSSYPEVRDAYWEIMDAFERAYFGDQPISREQFAKVWAMKPPFEEFLRAQDEAEAARAAASKEANARRLVPNRGFAKKSLLGVLAICALAAYACAGCKKQYWSEKYVEYSADINAPVGDAFRKSVNGVSVFTSFCSKSGRKADFRYIDSPQTFEQYDSIVWFYRSNMDVWALSTTLKQAATGEEISKKNAKKASRLLNSAWDADAPPEARAFFDIQRDVEKWLEAKPAT